MKNLRIRGLVFMTCFCFGMFSLAGQIETVWVGGSPGQETEWNCPKNWSTNQVPDWSSDVIIPNNFSDAQYFPLASEAIIEVNTMVIHPGAKLIISAQTDVLIAGIEKDPKGLIIYEQQYFSGL